MITTGVQLYELAGKMRDLIRSQCVDFLEWRKLFDQASVESCMTALKIAVDDCSATQIASAMCAMIAHLEIQNNK